MRVWGRWVLRSVRERERGGWERDMNTLHVLKKDSSATDRTLNKQE